MDGSETYAILSSRWAQRLGIEPLSPHVLVQPRELRMWFLRAFATDRSRHVHSRDALCKAFGIEDDRTDVWQRLCKDFGDPYTPLETLLNPQKAEGVRVSVKDVKQVDGSIFPMHTAESVQIYNSYTLEHVVKAYRQAAASMSLPQNPGQK